MSELIAAYSPVLKEYYTQDVIELLWYKDNPLFQMLKKDEKWGGKPYYRQPLGFSTGAGVGTNFAKARAAAQRSSNKYSEFQVLQVITHSLKYISTQLLRANVGNAASFIKDNSQIFDGAISNLSRDTAIALYRDGHGTRGKIAAAGISGATIQLTQVSDAFNFEVDQSLDLCSTLTGTAKAYGSSGNPLIVTGVDRDLGILTFGFNVTDATNGIPTAAPGDYIFIAGDVAASGLSKLLGLQGYLPDTAPAPGTLVFGCDVSVDTRLSGNRVDGTAGGSLVSVINQGVNKVGSVGGEVDAIFGSWNTYTLLLNYLESKRVIVLEPEEGEFGFKSVGVNTNRGMVPFYPDINCDDNHLYGLQMNTWKLASLGPAISMVDDDGLTWRLEQDQDLFGLRYWQAAGLVCRAPGYNFVAKLG